MSYSYQGKPYENIFSLAKDMYLDSDGFYQELKENPELLQFIAAEDSKKANHIQALLRQVLPSDILVFRVSNVLNPYMEFRFRKRCYTDFSLLGLDLLKDAPEEDPIGQEIVRFSLLSYYLLHSGKAFRAEERYKKIKAIEAEGENDPGYSYFDMAYYLSGKKTLFYHHVEYFDLYNFVYYQKKNGENLAVLGKELSLSPLLKAYGKYHTEDRHAVEVFLHLNEALERSQKTLEEASSRHSQRNMTILKENQ